MQDPRWQQGTQTHGPMHAYAWYCSTASVEFEFEYIYESYAWTGLPMHSRNLGAENPGTFSEQCSAILEVMGRSRENTLRN